VLEGIASFVLILRDFAAVWLAEESRRLSASAQRQYALTSSAAWRSRRLLLAVFCTGLPLLGWIAAEANRELARAANDRAWVSHTAWFIRRTMNLQDAVAQMQSDQRDLLAINADSERTASRDAAFRGALQALADLQRLTRNNPVQRLRLQAIGQSLAGQFASMRQATESRQQSGIEAVPVEVRDAHVFSLAALRQSIAEVDRTEAPLLEARSNAAASSSSRLTWLMWFAPGLGMLLLGAALWALLHQLQRSQRLAIELDRANTEAQHALALVDATHDGVFIYDAVSFGLSYVNQGGVNQLGYSRAELLGMTALDFKREFDGETFRKLLSPLMAGDVDSLALETAHRRRDGSLVPVDGIVSATAEADRGTCFCFELPVIEEAA
jgi:PAS domain S-box-containing protein